MAKAQEPGDLSQRGAGRVPPLTRGGRQVGLGREGEGWGRVWSLVHPKRREKSCLTRPHGNAEDTLRRPK